MSLNPSTTSSLAPLSPIDDPSLPSSIHDADLPLVPTLLATTTLAVRAIQAFAVSLPSTSTSAQLDNIRRGDDPLVVLRRTSLDVLGMLRELEARYRLPGATALEHDAAAVRAAGADDERRAGAPPLGDVDPPHGPRPVAPDSPPAPQYRTDVVLLALDSEAALVERWVRAVEGELERSGVRGGAVRAGGGRRRSSVRGGGEGQEGEGAGAQDEGGGAVLPDWARETGWPDGLGASSLQGCVCSSRCSSRQELTARVSWPVRSSGTIHHPRSRLNRDGRARSPRPCRRPGRLPRRAQVRRFFLFRSSPLVHPADKSISLAATAPSSSSRSTPSCATRPCLDPSASSPRPRFTPSLLSPSLTAAPSAHRSRRA